MRRSTRLHTGHTVRVAVMAVGVLALAGCGSEAQKVTAANLTPALSSPATSAPAQATTDPSTDASSPDDSPTEDPSLTPTKAATKKPKVTRTVTPSPTRSAKGSVTPTKKATPTPTKKPTASPTPSKTLDPAELAAAAADVSTALQGATSVHVTGRVVTAAGTFGVDLQDGTNGGGTLTYSKGTIQVQRIGTDLFLNADDAFFTGHGHPELVAAYHGKWMPILPEDPAYANILPLTNASSWTKLLGTVTPSTAADGGVVGGVPTIAVTGGSGAKSATLFISTVAPTLPLQALSGDKVDKLTFTGWNATNPSLAKPTALKDEPEDSVLDVPTFPEATAEAFSKLWNS